MRIIFMGTPHFAVPSLDILVENGFEVVAVITATDKMGGRGNKKLLQSPVKKYAVSKGIPVLQPKNLKSKKFIAELRSYKADLQVVVAFRMLPVVVWDMPTKGTINLHGSLLPKYRGAAPINWAVINGDKETGVTTFFIQHKIDTGNLLFQDSLPIGENDTAGEVHDKMMLVGANLLLKTAKAISTDDITPIEQDNSKATHAPKIFHETCAIDFDKNLDEIHDFIRGMSPYPTAWASLSGKQFKIFKSIKIDEPDHGLEPKTIVADNKNLKIAVKGGFLSLKEVQLQGKRKMNVGDFLNGFNGELLIA